MDILNEPNMDMITEAMGFTAVLISYITCIPQIIKLIKRKSSADLSKATYFLLLAVDLLYLVRAIYINELVFILGKIWASFVVAFQLVLIYIFRQKPNKKQE